MITRDLRRLVDNILTRTPEVSLARADVQSSVTGESVVFVIDSSGSMESPCGAMNRLEAAKRATKAYISARYRLSSTDSVAAVVFNDAATVISSSVNIQRAERSLLNPLRRVSADGGTEITSGLLAAQSILAVSTSDILRRCVVLSDGGDCGSSYHTADSLKASGIIIDTVGVGESPSDINEACLKRMASTVNGVLRYKFINDADQLVEHFETMALGLARV